MCYQLVFDKKYAINIVDLIYVEVIIKAESVVVVYAVFLWLVKILDIQQGDSLPRYLLVRYGVV
jgi:hypothetical protein